MSDAEKSKKTTPVVNPNPKSLLRNTFSTSYLVLFGYTIITLVEALRTSIPGVRHIMNIETAVSIIAGFVYSQFQEMMKQPIPDFDAILQLRYVDWSITTPLIILALLLFYNGSNNVPFITYLLIVALDYGMLASGYMGETGMVSKLNGSLVGFGFFLAMLVLIYSCCIGKNNNPSIFIVFALLWTGYGIAYWLDEESKNIAYNLLDVCSKAIFGIILWLYFGKVVKF
jgi:bacteriorhodopsin